MTPAADIVLVCMPFGHVFSPSMGLGLLKAELAAQDMSARVLYFSIPFAEAIGQDFYYRLSTDSRPSIEDLAGEWIFSRALFGTGAPDEAYLDDILRGRATWTTNDSTRPASPALIRSILRAREHVDSFLQWCREEIVRLRPRLVGFTSVFQQHVASLALARRVKDALPDAVIVFGGANCEGPMGAETVRQFPFVDAAVSGEADLVFPELARRVLAGRSLAGLPGVRTRDGVESEFTAGRFSPAPMVRDLDALPYPDYRDYFEQFASSRFGREWQPSIFFETSRGCWWGERMHCTFCGLNGQAMSFRSKSAGRVLAELDGLTRRHRGCDVMLTDNILDMRYFKDLLPALAARRPVTRLFYEVKSNLSKPQLRMLREAGIESIQPGIESLSDPVLKLMRKGVSGLQNIQLLKWCKELGITPGWNLLWGFPGEPEGEYARMASLVPLLTHLPPPSSHGMIRLDRFSPNYDQSDRLGFAEVRPVPSYRYVYPLPPAVLANLAYFFTFRYRESRDVPAYVGRLAKRVHVWRKRSKADDLFSVEAGDYRLVWDLRARSRSPLTMLRGEERVLYEACDSASDLRRLGESLARGEEGTPPAEAIVRRLEPLLRRGLLMQDGPRYLALAVSLGEYCPPPPAVERFYDCVHALGSRVRGGWVVPRSVAADGFRGAPVGSLRRRVRPSRRWRRRRLTVSQFSIDDRGDVLIHRAPRS